jgi:hypothetical protein
MLAVGRRSSREAAREVQGREVAGSGSGGLVRKGEGSSSASEEKSIACIAFGQLSAAG